MGGPIAVDTPDYQRGVVSAQKLLATVAAGTDHVTVGIPPNAESIIVTADSFITPPVVYCEGVSTLYKYDGVHGPQKNLITVADTWAFDVSYPMDQQVTVQFSEAPSDQWYVYADSAARVQFDGSGRYDNQGSQFVVPTVPNTAAGDHPAIELSYASATVGNGGVVLAAPGAGNRYRIFAAQIGNFSMSVDASMFDSNGVIFCTTHAVNPAVWFTYPLTGIALPINSHVGFGAGGGTCTAVVVYTTEDV